MAPEPDPNSERGSQILLAQQTQSDTKAAGAGSALPLRNFRLSDEQVEQLRKRLGITGAEISETKPALLKIYTGFLTQESEKKTGTLGITYKENNGLIKTPAEVLETHAADCDETTRSAYQFAALVHVNERKITGVVMAEMHWTDPETKKPTGHSVILHIPENTGEMPYVYDLTHQYQGKALESRNLEDALKKKYASDAVNPDFRIMIRHNLNEVEAAHYDQVGEHYDKKNWKLVGEAYERAVKLVPNDFKYNRNLAFAYLAQKRYNEAILYYQQCLISETYKNDPKVHAELGSAYANTGAKTKGKEELEKALSLGPDAKLQRKINVRLARLYAGEGLQLWKQDKKEEAFKFYEKAYGLDQNNEGISRDYKRLKHELGK